MQRLLSSYNVPINAVIIEKNAEVMEAFNARDGVRALFVVRFNFNAALIAITIGAG